MIEILQVKPGSIGEELGLDTGDRVMTINGKAVTDALDYKYYITNEEVELEVLQGEDSTVFEIEKDYDDDLGLILEDLELRSCGNACIFCFVFQNPKGLRKSLYFKDEDFRYSFMYGHYTTLTNASEEDLKRIVEQRLSPLYISVHVTDRELRKIMLGIKFDDHLLEKIDFLTQNGIELNCQIVLCPELNDKTYLDKTIEDLKKYYPKIQSLAIVPVGLTSHRKNLYNIKPVTHQYSLNTIKETNERRTKLKAELGSSFVYLSDEFYIRTETKIPTHDYYEGFYQLENGVGLTRHIINNLEAEISSLKNPSPFPLKLSLVTGTLGAKVFNKYIIHQLKKIPDVLFKLHPVINRFYGSTITVSGLLVGEDIIFSLKQRQIGDYIVLPPDCLNEDGIFLDDMSILELEKKLSKKPFIFPGSFTKLFKMIAEYETTASNNCRPAECW